jgi:hypothetical protein
VHVIVNQNDETQIVSVHIKIAGWKLRCPLTDVSGVVGGCGGACVEEVFVNIQHMGKYIRDNASNDNHKIHCIRKRVKSLENSIFSNLDPETSAAQLRL